MGTHPNQHQDKHILPDLINKEPVRLKMAFMRTRIITGQFMVPIRCIQFFTIRQYGYGIKKLIHLLVLFLCPLQILPELGCEFNFTFHTSSAFLSSVMSL